MAALLHDDINRAARFALRHYVPFSYYARPSIRTDNVGMVAQPCVCSAFVIEVRDIWCLVTAGHVLDGIDAERRSGLELVSFRLWDGWAPNAQHRAPVPFDYDEPPKIRLNRDGLDYGLIPLSPLHVANLKANGVVPISAEHYAKDWPAEFHGHAMIGTPGGTVGLEHVSGRSTRFSQSVYVIQLAEERTPPSELVQPNPRFYGKILMPEDSPEWQAIGRDIRGMSGGPVIGVRRQEGGVSYWIIGVQSGWLASKRVVAACYFQAFARHVDEMLRLINE